MILFDFVSCFFHHFVIMSVSSVAELGDYSETEHPPAYLSEYGFIPNPPQDFHKEVSKHHQQHRYAWTWTAMLLRVHLHTRSHTDKKLMCENVSMVEINKSHKLYRVINSLFTVRYLEACQNNKNKEYICKICLFYVFQYELTFTNAHTLLVNILNCLASSFN